MRTPYNFLEHALMKAPLKKTVAAAFLAGWIAATGAVIAADRPADQILGEIDTIKMPQVDRTKTRDQAYVQDYLKKRQETMAKKGVLIRELYKVAPEHERLATLLPERWSTMSPFGPQAKELADEINQVYSHAKDPQLKLQATYFKAQLGMVKAQSGEPLDMAAINEFISLAPKNDQRVPNLLYNASTVVKDDKVKSELEDRLLKDFAGSQFADAIKSGRRQRESIGKPFELEFTDAIKGSTVSVKNLKGKVVVIDFWATWCGPCVAEMPHMKELYAKYRDQGVEFIGVSLDRPKEQGGLDALKKYVADNKIEWPQYYQGNYWNSEFSKSWGIQGIPTMFVVDTEGKLFSVEARGKLDQMIPELLKKKGPAGAGASGGF
jgi:thiol-disulfide isomerase/thioredoxin